jgi:hypothetical protein
LILLSECIHENNRQIEKYGTDGIHQGEEVDGMLSTIINIILIPETGRSMKESFRLEVPKNIMFYFFFISSGNMKSQNGEFVIHLGITFGTLMAHTPVSVLGCTSGSLMSWFGS